MQDITVIYILPLKGASMFKIGQTKSLETRVSKLQQLWGEFDFNKSIIITSEFQDQSTIESSLHNVFIKHRVNNLSRKEGYREFFDSEALPLVLEYLKELKRFRTDIKIYSFNDIKIDIKKISSDSKIIAPMKEKSDKKIATYITKSQLNKFYQKAAEQNLNVSGMLRELVLDFIKD